MSGLILASFLLIAGPCAYLQLTGWPEPTCGGESRAAVPPVGGAVPRVAGPKTPDCETGLPPQGLRRVLADRRVCVGARLYERVPSEAFDPPDYRQTPLPEAAVIERLCRAPVPVPRPRRWWHPVISLSVERGARWSFEARGLMESTTVWVSLSFPLPATGVPPGPVRRDRAALCAAAKRLGRAFARVGDAGLRHRARLQLMTWRDELSSD